jgi:outer membrane protein insertion porin family
MQMKWVKYAMIGIISLIGLSSCNTTKYLEDEELLLTGNSIKIYGKKNIDQKRAMSYQLSLLYKQTENNKFFFIPRQWFYFKTQDDKDTTKFDRWQRRVIAEKPAIYDPKLKNATEESMTFFLQNKGYFNASVFSDPDVRAKKKKVSITYHVTPGPQFTIDTVSYYSSDSTVNALLQKIAPNGLLKRGSGIEGKLYEQEKKRITTYLRNHGYAFFYSNFILPLEADTTIKSKQAAISLEVAAPYGDSIHQAYKIGDIDVYMDYLPGQEECCLLDTLINGVRIQTSLQDFNVDPQTIYDAIYIAQGQLFSQANLDKTNQQLTSLGVHRYVRLKQLVDTSRQNILNIRIELTPHKKIELGFDVEFNFASRNASGAGNLIGLTASPSLRNRNLIKGAELLVTNFSAGVEFSPSPTDIAAGNFWNTVDLRLQSSLYVPRFGDYLGLWKTMSRIKKPKDVSEDAPNTFYEDMVENAVTRFSANYNYLLVRDFYQYDLFSATYGFDVQRGSNQRLIFNHVGIDYLFPETRPDFDAILAVNPFLANSFGEQLFASFVFRDLNYVYNSKPNKRGGSYYVGYNLELAGAELWAGNKLYNALTSTSETFRLRINNRAPIDFSQYIRTEIDIRRYWQQTPGKSLALRLAFGIARPFGFTSDVPYVKQFFVGGPNSVRAWAPRGLGPGAFEDPLSRDIDNNTRLYQTGDIKIEANLEYRFKIFWLMEGALFLDAGNVWTIEQDTNRCGSQFLISPLEDECINEEGNRISFLHEPFYRQLAVGGGFGFRFDFSYFILRLDLATKLRHSYPYLPTADMTATEADYWFQDYKRGFSWSKIAFNLGFGYPF